MCFASTPTPKDPPPIQTPATIADPQVQEARDDTNRRNRQASGSQSTILSSLFNVPQVGVGGKTLLGQ